MDKQKTITIKINGKDRSYKQEDSKNKEQTQEDQSIKTPKISAWNETAVSQEIADDQFDWILPEPMEENGDVSTPKKSKGNGFRLPAINKNTKYSGMNAINKNKNKKTSSGIFPRIFLNVFLAVAVGLGFGLMILNTVTSDSKEEAIPSDTELGAETNTPVASNSESVELPSISTFVVQEGVYTTKENAQSVIQELKTKGIPGQEVAYNNQFVVLMAIAGSLEEAKAKASDLKAKGAEVYAKPYEMAGTTVQDLNKDENAVLTIAPELFKVLSSGNMSNADSVSKVKAQASQLKEIDENKLKNKDVSTMKLHLEKGAAAFVAKDRTQLQTENLALLAAWQSFGK